MDRASVQSAFNLSASGQNSALPGSFVWSPESTVMTYTAGSLLDFSKSYRVHFAGQVRASVGNSTDLAGGSQANSWTFTTTGTTRVESHYPDSSTGQAMPGSQFGFNFNNPIAPQQNVAQYLTISPVPEGYNGILEVSDTTVVTSEIKLLPNTTYTFTLKEGLKDKWSSPVAPSSWQVEIGPLPPSFILKGGTFQPVYSGGPSRVRIEAANLDKLTFQLYQLSESDARAVAEMSSPIKPNTWDNPQYYGQEKRKWDVTVPKSDVPSTIYPTVALDANSDRLPPGYYTLRVTAPTPYGNKQLEGAVVLIVGRTGVVTKMEGRNLLVWAADLSTGKPVASYLLRIEQFTQPNYNLNPPAPTAPIVQREVTGADGVLRLTLTEAKDVIESSSGARARATLCSLLQAGTATSIRTTSASRAATVLAQTGVGSTPTGPFTVRRTLSITGASTGWTMTRATLSRHRARL